nr:transcriptional regulator [Pseudonocardiales bacterium]
MPLDDPVTGQAPRVRNVYRLSLHPDGLPPRLRNRPEWTAHLGHRLTRLARLTGDPRLSEL